MKKNKYYARQWHIDHRYEQGSRRARYFWFSSRAQRDAWVEFGSLYNGPGYREPVAGRDPELRRLHWRERRRDERGLWIEPMK